MHTSGILVVRMFHKLLTNKLAGDINLMFTPLYGLVPQGGYLVYKPTDLLDESGLQIDPKKIEQLKQYNPILINCSTENWGAGFITWFDQVMSPYNLKYIILSHNPTDHLIKPHVVFYPCYYYGAAEVNRQFEHTDIQLERKYKLSCLNRVPRLHRILNYITLSKKDYFKDCLFSLHQTSKESTYIANKDEHVELGAEILAEWDILQPTLPKQQGVDLLSSNDAYTNSYINLVTESNITPTLYVSEKVWKPISVGQLFIVIGCAGTISYLRDMGVDVFDDIIDHKYYDSETNTNTRIEKIHTLLDSLVLQDLHKIYQDTEQRRKLNVANFFNGSFNQKYENSLLECINTQN